jgi:hypothetical protein
MMINIIVTKITFKTLFCFFLVCRNIGCKKKISKLIWSGWKRNKLLQVSLFNATIVHFQKKFVTKNQNLKLDFQYEFLNIYINYLAQHVMLMVIFKQEKHK